MIWNTLAWIVTLLVGWILGWLTWRNAAGGTVRVIDNPGGDDDVYVHIGRGEGISTWFVIDSHVSVEVDSKGRVVALSLRSIDRWFQRCRSAGYRALPEIDSTTRMYRFVPQAWVNDHAVDADRNGEDTFEAPVALSDYDKVKVYAPDWAKEWSGPWELRQLE